MLKWSQVNIPTPNLSPARDLADDPRYRRALLVRWVWRIYTQRLTTAGRWFALLSGALVSYSGASLQLQGYIPAAYVGGIWAVAIAAMLFWRPKVTLAAEVTDRVAAGERATCNLTVTNRSRLRGGDLVLIPHRLPIGIEADPDLGLSLPDLAKGQAVSTTLHLRCTKRGSYDLKGFRVESGFPFGILRSRRTFLIPHKLLVYPRFTRLASLPLPTGRRYQPGGVALASEIGESFEYRGNREYREGDNVRDIDWRATARVGAPIVREWVEEYMLRVAVVLDTQLPPAKAAGRKTRKEREQDFERAVSVAASVSDFMARSDYLVDLFAAGPDLYHLTAGRSLAYLDQILDILTCVEPSDTPGFSKIEPQLAALLERLSTVILILLDLDEPRRAFAESLAAQGCAVKIILVRSSKPALDPTLLSPSFGPIPLIDSDDLSRALEER